MINAERPVLSPRSWFERRVAVHHVRADGGDTLRQTLHELHVRGDRDQGLLLPRRAGRRPARLDDRRPAVLAVPDRRPPRLGDVEIWRFVVDLHHPIHLHLVNFSVVKGRA
jgi:hypothetical protein